jgi:hypothetical protein
MKDRIRARAHFLEIQFRGGGSRIITASDIKGIQVRREGGTSIRLQNDHIVLVDCRVADVMAALELATEGGRHATAT